MVRKGNGKRRTWYRLVLIALITVGFLMPAPAPVLAQAKLVVGSTLLGLVIVPLVAYGLYENLPSRQGKERLIKGEFYAAGYMGAAFTPSQDLNFGSGSLTLYNNKFGSSVVGGGKIGYFNDRIPYLGAELETNVSRTAIRRTGLDASRSIRGAAAVTMAEDDWLNLVVAFHLVGRYGFLPDQEVPFGRLQPYVGVGPAAVIHCGNLSTAGNYGIDVMSGLRYMLLKNVSMFVEYKYTHVFNTEMSMQVYLHNGQAVQAAASFPLDNHKVVLGAGYHW